MVLPLQLYKQIHILPIKNRTEHNRTHCINLNISSFTIIKMWKTFYQEPFISFSYILKASLNDVARRHISNRKHSLFYTNGLFVEKVYMHLVEH